MIYISAVGVSLEKGRAEPQHLFTTGVPDGTNEAGRLAEAAAFLGSTAGAVVIEGLGTAEEFAGLGVRIVAIRGELDRIERAYTLPEVPDVLELGVDVDGLLMMSAGLSAVRRHMDSAHAGGDLPGFDSAWSLQYVLERSGVACAHCSQNLRSTTAYSPATIRGLDLQTRTSEDSQSRVAVGVLDLPFSPPHDRRNEHISHARRVVTSQSNHLFDVAWRGMQAA